MTIFGRPEVSFILGLKEREMSRSGKERRRRPIMLGWSRWDVFFCCVKRDEGIPSVGPRQR